MTQILKANLGLLFAGIGTFILMGAGQALYGPALPGFARDFGLTVPGAGALISAHWVGCFVGVGAMYLAARHISAWMVLGGMGLGAVLIAAGLGWVVTLLGGFVFGIGYGVATALFNPRMLRAFGARGPAMVSLLNATFGIGAIAAPLVFVGLGNDPKLSFALVAGLCVLVLMGAITDRQTAVAAVPGAVRVFRPDLRILAFGMVAIGMEACMIGLGPTALIRAGATEVEAAEMLSAFFVTFLGARVVLVFTAHLIRPFALFTLGVALAAALGLGAVFLSPGVFFVATGACVGMFFPGFYVTASGLMGEDQRVAPTIIAAGLMGGILSPLALAPVMEHMGERGFFQITAGVMLVLALVALVMRRRLDVSAR